MSSCALSQLQYVVPGYLVYRAVACRCILLDIPMLLAKPEELLHGHILRGQSEAASDALPAPFLPLANPELSRLRHHHHCLPLPIDVPLPLALDLSGRQLLVDLLQLLFHLPLPQQPLGRSVYPRIGVVLIQLQQPRQKVQSLGLR